MDKTILLGNKLTLHQEQLGFLKKVVDSSSLLESRILPSVQPKIGRKFHYVDLERKKLKILLDARIQILNECAKVEKIRDVNNVNNTFSKELSKKINDQQFQIRVKSEIDKTRNGIVQRLSKKVNFHLDQISNTETNTVTFQTKKKSSRNKFKAKAHDKVVENRRKYRRRKREKKKEWMTQKIVEIKNTLVFNLSSQEIPDIAYLYLAKGLNFVESKGIKKEELLYDTKQFLRKMEWKGYFNDLGRDDNEVETDIHHDLRIKSSKHPEGYSNPLYDEIRTKVLGFVSNYQPKDPKSNLTNAETRGKNWLLQKINAQSLFVTKADKGGATIIVDWDTAVEAIRNKLDKSEKFLKLRSSVEDKLPHAVGPAHAREG